MLFLEIEKSRGKAEVSSISGSHGKKKQVTGKRGRTGNLRKVSTSAFPLFFSPHPQLFETSRLGIQAAAPFTS